jgi:predicted dehydrogenase
LNRRHFIKKSGSAIISSVSAPFLIPASALGRDNNVPPSDRIVMGCIGLGGQGTHNMHNFMNKKDVQVVALSDVDKGSNTYRDGSVFGLEQAKHQLKGYYSRQNRSGKFEGCDTYTNFRELLERKDIDAVTVCTPDHWHGLISIAAAKAGKDIYCEKPLTNSIAEGRAVCNAVKRYGKILQTGSHERSNDSVRYACELVRNGYIGKLENIFVNMPNNDSHHNFLRNDNSTKPDMNVPESLDYDMWLGPSPWATYTQMRCHFWWRFIHQYGGGEMSDRGAHIIDLAQFANNSDGSGPIEVVARGEALKNELWDVFMEYEFELTYKDGIKIIGSSNGERGLKLVGSDGWIFIHVHGGRLKASSDTLLRTKIKPEDIFLGRTPSHQQNFLDAVRNRTEPFATTEIGHRTASICHLLNIAMLTGNKLNWDPQNERITNDAEINRLLSRPMRNPWQLG